MKKIVKFVKEALQELSKVTWPTRPTVIRLTIGVILVSLLFAAFIGLADLGLSNGLRGLLGLIGKTSTSQQGGVS